MNNIYRIAIIIPCYNEELTIVDTINEWKSIFHSADVIICDNNSIDRTRELAENAGAIVLEETTQGKGAAVKTLFTYCYFSNYDCIFLIDGDYTYPATKATQSLYLIEQGYDMVVGSRLKQYMKKSKNIIKKLGNKYLSYLSKKCINKNIEDPLSGYRVFSRKFIENYIHKYDGFELETYFNIYATKNNFNVISLDIDYRDRPRGSKSKIRLKDGFIILSLTKHGLEEQ